MLWPKKNSYKEFDNEKNSCGSNIPSLLPSPPPITFLMVRPLINLSFADIVTATLGTLGTPEQRLRHDLLDKYHHDVRPVLHPDETVNVSFSYRMSRVVSLVSQG